MKFIHQIFISLLVFYTQSAVSFRPLLPRSTSVRDRSLQSTWDATLRQSATKGPQFSVHHPHMSASRVGETFSEPWQPASRDSRPIHSAQQSSAQPAPERDSTPAPAQVVTPATEHAVQPPPAAASSFTSVYSDNSTSDSTPDPVERQRLHEEYVSTLQSTPGSRERMHQEFQELLHISPPERKREQNTKFYALMDVLSPSQQQPSSSSPSTKEIEDLLQRVLQILQRPKETSSQQQGDSTADRKL